jgi:MoaA/NifB/PqqE/SkfB family radical SAM enzyme
MIKVNVMVEKEVELDINFGDKFKLKRADGFVEQPFIYTITDTNKLQAKSISGNYFDSSLTLQDIAKGKWKIIKLPQKPFWPNSEDEYYYIDADGSIYKSVYIKGYITDSLNAKLGNCFKSSNISQEQIDTFLAKMNNKEIIQL